MSNDLERIEDAVATLLGGVPYGPAPNSVEAVYPANLGPDIASWPVVSNAELRRRSVRHLDLGKRVFWPIWGRADGTGVASR